MSSSPIYHKNVIEFVTVAKEYILFMDNTNSIDKTAFVFKAQKILALLYLKTSLLPKIENIFDEGNERFCTEELYDRIQEKTHKLLRSNDNEILINYDSQDLDEQELIKLSEIFTDIYQSLFDFLNLYRIGTEEMMNDALWECQQDFKSLWGRKLISTLNNLHRMLYENLINEDDLDFKDESPKQNTENWFTEKLKNNDE